MGFSGKAHARNERGRVGGGRADRRYDVAESSRPLRFDRARRRRLPYEHARRRADPLSARLCARSPSAADPPFTSEPGKFGDLAGYPSAYPPGADRRGSPTVGPPLLAPPPIAFAEAIPIAALGLIVNAASAWLLSRATAEEAHLHRHTHGDAHGADDHGGEREPHGKHAPRQQPRLGDRSRRRRRGGFDPGHRRPAARARLRLAVDGSGCGPDRRRGDCELVGQPDPRKKFGAALLDINPDPGLAERLRGAIEREGDGVRRRSSGRLGPGHLRGAIRPRGPKARARLATTVAPR